MPWTAGSHNFVGDVFSQVTLPQDWQFCLIFNGNSLSSCCQITLGWLLICVFKGLQEMDTVRVQKANGQDLKTLFVTSHMLRHEYFFNVCWLIYNIHVHIMVTRLTFNTYFTPRPRPALRLFFFFLSLFRSFSAQSTAWQSYKTVSDSAGDFNCVTNVMWREQCALVFQGITQCVTVAMCKLGFSKCHCYGNCGLQMKLLRRSAGIWAQE